MTKSREETSHDPGRRKFLKGVGIAGAGAAISICARLSIARRRPSASASAATAMSAARLASACASSTLACSCCECSRSLRSRVRHDLGPGKAAKDRQRQGDSWIQMRTRDLAGDVNAHRNRQPPSERDVGKPAVNDFSGIPGWEQDHHGDNAIAEQDENERSEELGDEFRSQTGF